MTLLPRSLFGRLVLLLVAVVALAVLTSILMFRHDRAELLVRQFGDTKLAQLQALRAALESADVAALSTAQIRALSADTIAALSTDARFERVRALPEFQKLASTGRLPRGFFNGTPGSGHLNKYGNEIVGQLLAKSIEQVFK